MDHSPKWTTLSPPRASLRQMILVQADHQRRQIAIELMLQHFLRILHREMHGLEDVERGTRNCGRTLRD